MPFRCTRANHFRSRHMLYINVLPRLLFDTRDKAHHYISTSRTSKQASIKREDSKDWDASLKCVQRDLNELKNATTGRNPFESLYGYVATHNEDWLRTLLKADETYVHNHKIRHESLAERIINQQKSIKSWYDKNRAKNIKFKEGTWFSLHQIPLPRASP